MTSPQTCSILFLLILSGPQVFSQYYEDNYSDYETEDVFLPEAPRFPVPEQPDYDARVTYPNECARECVCPPSYPFAMYCDHRKLKTIPDVPGHIRHLYIQHNDIEAITAKPFVNATSLRDINLSYNNLQSSKVDKDIFKTLTELIQLHLEHNNLEEIPSPLPKTLQRLHLGFNQISKIPADAVRQLTKLTALDLCNNRLTDASFKGKILSDLKNLMQINICSNKLKSMPGDLPESLMQITLDNNSISSIPEGYFKKTPNLLSLRMSHNKLKSVPHNVFNLSRLMELHLGHNQLSKLFFVPRTLEHLYLNHNEFKDLNISLMCSNVLDLSNPNMLTYIRLDNNKLRASVDYTYMYGCFPRLRTIFHGIQRQPDEDDLAPKKPAKPDPPKRPGSNEAIDTDV